MNNPFDYAPDALCREAFDNLMKMLGSLKESKEASDVAFCRELEAGKMLGVLVAVDSEDVRHTLFAFSGQIGERGFWRDGFVGPVFDYLRPDGYFKTKEREISSFYSEIERFERGDLSEARDACESMREAIQAELSERKEMMRRSKMQRDARRASPEIDEAEKEALVRRSQFEKAELRRLKQRNADRLLPFEAKLKEAEEYLGALKRMRRERSEALQQWLFTNFRVLNARGEWKCLSEIFAETAMKTPPSGAGECCAPKLLQAAYLRGWTPVSIAEYWYGKAKEGEVRIHGEHYPACRGKCLPLLSWMLQGLPVQPPLGSEGVEQGKFSPEIVYENEWFCVVNKPSGMLSVPGKGNSVSVQDWLVGRYGEERGVKMAHRLDRDTSGLLIATFDPEAFRMMQALFATRKVRKTYEALLQGDYIASGVPRQGRISLPLTPDWLDRPRQRVDEVEGKEAVTEYEFVKVDDECSRVIFHPLTGRTHQLRVHSASAKGLGMPICGDPLYGKRTVRLERRLYLHARRIEFSFPLDGRDYAFEIATPF
ncbi:MAG: RNA pseudouridine synthase [Bacteroidales bacterium]|nr:RNA pseudouridine synthase [Bacteroidales bacterium]